MGSFRLEISQFMEFEKDALGWKKISNQPNLTQSIHILINHDTENYLIQSIQDYRPHKHKTHMAMKGPLYKSGIRNVLSYFTGTDDSKP